MNSHQVRSLVNEVYAWIKADPDWRTQQKLRALLSQNRYDELARLFAAPLTFGTAGLRGPVAPGPAGMNRATVRHATLGVSEWLWAQGEDAAARGVVVGRDARIGSEEFCDETVRTLSACGIPVHLLEGPLPTPYVPFAVLDRQAGAGIMITASHNPREDNGYKLYDATASQVLPDGCTTVEAGMARARSGALTHPSESEWPLRSAPVTLVKSATWDRYRATLVARYGVRAGNELAPGATASDDRQLRIAYTPLCGVGGEECRRLLETAGYQVDVVDSQFHPDGTFPGLPFPNPEEPGVLDALMARAREVGAHVALANDPDADRLSVSVPTADGTWRSLTGDEVGALLGWMALEALTATGEQAEQGVPVPTVATTIVSSQLLGVMAASRGVRYVETLTGFRWISRAGRTAHSGTPEQGPPFAEGFLAFGYEEALGYAIDPRVPDKDGLSAAVAVARLAHELLGTGRTLLDLLDDIARAHGVYVTAQRSWRTGDDPEGQEAATALRQRIRDLATNPPVTLAPLTRFGLLDRAASADDLADPYAVVSTIDLSAGSATLPATDGVALHLAAGQRVVIRPSGTENKVKAYIEVVAPVPEGPADRLASIRAQAAGEVALLGDAIATLLGQ